VAEPGDALERHLRAETGQAPESNADAHSGVLVDAQFLADLAAQRQLLRRPVEGAARQRRETPLGLRRDIMSVARLTIDIKKNKRKRIVESELSVCRTMLKEKFWAKNKNYHPK